MSKYVPIHVHSCYSIRDGLSKLPDLTDRAKELGIESLAITEHGFLGSAFKFYNECKKKEIKPIIGFEAYYSDSIVDEKINYHLCIYAKNNNGFKNLSKLSSEAYIDNFYKKPRVNFEMLQKYKDDLIISTACMQSVFSQLIINNQIDDANAMIDKFHKLFKDDFYLEIHNHGIDEEITIRNHLRNYGREKDIKLVAGTDCHYVLKSDKTIHNIFKQLAYNSVGKGDDSFDGSGYHLLSYEEMTERFNQDEIDNTLEIANKCNMDFNHSEYRLPKYEVPNKEMDSYEYLKNICYKWLKENGHDKDQKYIDRLEFELEQMHLSNLEDYMLIVADYCNWCKNNDIMVGPGRGSVGNSLLAIASGISEVDSVKYDLIYGRFNNPGRVLQYDFGV